MSYHDDEWEGLVGCGYWVGLGVFVGAIAVSLIWWAVA